MIVMSTSVLRSRRASRRAHSNPVNPLPTITTDVTMCMLPPDGDYKPGPRRKGPLRAGQQGAELGGQPWLVPAGPQLAAQKLRQLRHSTEPQGQKSQPDGGGYANGPSL